MYKYIYSDETLSKEYSILPLFDFVDEISLELYKAHTTIVNDTFGFEAIKEIYSIAIERLENQLKQ